MVKAPGILVVAFSYDYLESGVPAKDRPIAARTFGSSYINPP
jgi:hypothetical protein